MIGHADHKAQLTVSISTVFIYAAQVYIMALESKWPDIALSSLVSQAVLEY